MSVIIPVILCGGSGTRLWPLSRSDRPKQLIALTGDHTLLEGTLMRAKTIAGAGDPICVTAADTRPEVRQSLDRLGLRGRLLLEPEPRNTAPALTAAALVACDSDADAIIVALPADHIIEDSAAFAASIGWACAAAQKGWLVTLGVRPRQASAALGYIMPDAGIDGLPHVSRVKRFIEKPTAEVAQGLIETGGLWNAGIVVARADQLIVAMRKHDPAVLEAIGRSLEAGQSGADDVHLGKSEFAAAPNISFDKAVLERHESVAVTALATMWRDVGTWAEVAELHNSDMDGNRHTGRVHLSASRNSFVFSPHRLTVGIGLTDLVVVDTPDALLVANGREIGQLRAVVEAMATASYPEVAADVRSVASDGHLVKVVSGDATHAHRFSLRAGETTRREPHQDVSRHWIVLQGTVQVTIGNQVSSHGANQSFRVAPGVSHIIDNKGSAPVKLIEVHLMAKATH